MGYARRFAQVLLAAGCLLPLLAFPSASQPIPVPSADLKPWPAASHPALLLADLDGKPQDLAARAGSVVIVHFFATWCEPCRGELQSLRDVTSSMGRDVVVLAVNVAEVPARVRTFLAETPVPFPVLMDRDRAATKRWAVHTLPTSFVLDRGLVPRLTVEGDIDWTAAGVRRALQKIAAGEPR